MKICPYVYTASSTIVKWQNDSDNLNGKQVTTTLNVPAHCLEDKCGAWNGGKCNYNSQN